MIKAIKMFLWKSERIIDLFIDLGYNFSEEEIEAIHNMKINQYL